MEESFVHVNWLFQTKQITGYEQVKESFNYMLLGEVSLKNKASILTFMKCWIKGQDDNIKITDQNIKQFIKVAKCHLFI